jgi:hypothetical protein
MSLIPAFEIGVWNAWIFMIWLLIQNYGIKFLNKEIYQKAGGSSEEASLVQKITGYISVTLWLLTTLYSIFLPLKLGTIWFYIGICSPKPGLFGEPIFQLVIVSGYCVPVLVRHSTHSTEWLIVQ